MEEQHTLEPRGENTESQSILEFGSSLIQSKRGTIHVLTIVGQIEGHQVLPPTSKSTKYEHVMPLLALVEESDEIDGLLVLLNTVGGDIEAGLGIAELIASMSKPTVSLVLGGGHSIGVPLAVSAKRSFIAPSAAMTIHPVRLNGLVIGVPQTFYYFERIQERITQFVTANSRIKRDDFTKLMLQTGELAADVGSVIYGEEAVELGLIDEIGGLSDALTCLHKMIEQRKSARRLAVGAPSQMGRRGSAVQAFCRRQNLADGGIYFRRLNKKKRGPHGTCPMGSRRRWSWA